MADRRQLYEYLGDRCGKCGKTVQEMMERFGDFSCFFDFNHIDPTLKHPQYKNVIRRVLSTEQLDEVDKCVLLCKECHVAAHLQDMTARLTVTITLNGHTAEQTFTGQLIKDYVDHTVTFLTNERPLLHPYRVTIGDAEPQIRFGTELRQGQLIELWNRISEIKRLSVSTMSDALMLEVSHLGGSEIAIKQDLGFPVLSYELSKDDGHSIFLWVRHGIGLTHDGKVLHNGLIEAQGNIVAPYRR